MSKETKTIVDANVVVWLSSIVDHVKNGWEVNWEVEPGFFGYLYEAELTKSEKNNVEESEEQNSEETSVPQEEEIPAQQAKRGPKPKGK